MGQPVAVGVQQRQIVGGVEQVRTRRRLGAVVHAAVVGVRVDRARAVAEHLGPVGLPVAVGVGLVRVALSRADAAGTADHVGHRAVAVGVLGAVGQPVVIAVRVRRARRRVGIQIRLPDVDVRATEAAAARQFAARHGVGHAQLQPVAEAVAVTVGRQRVGAGAERLAAVRDPVVVGVGVQRIRAQPGAHLLRVAQPVSVRVLRGAPALDAQRGRAVRVLLAGVALPAGLARAAAARRPGQAALHRADRERLRRAERRARPVPAHHVVAVDAGQVEGGHVDAQLVAQLVDAHAIGAAVAPVPLEAAGREVVGVVAPPGVVHHREDAAADAAHLPLRRARLPTADPVVDHHEPHLRVRRLVQQQRGAVVELEPGVGAGVVRVPVGVEVDQRLPALVGGHAEDLAALGDLIVALQLAADAVDAGLGRAVRVVVARLARRAALGARRPAVDVALGAVVGAIVAARLGAGPVVAEAAQALPVVVARAAIALPAAPAAVDPGLRPVLDPVLARRGGAGAVLTVGARAVGVLVTVGARRAGRALRPATIRARLLAVGDRVPARRLLAEPVVADPAAAIAARLAAGHGADDDRRVDVLELRVAAVGQHHVEAVDPLHPVGGDGDAGVVGDALDRQAVRTARRPAPLELAVGEVRDVGRGLRVVEHRQGGCRRQPGDGQVGLAAVGVALGVVDDDQGEQPHRVPVQEERRPVRLGQVGARAEADLGVVAVEVADRLAGQQRRRLDGGAALGHGVAAADGDARVGARHREQRPEVEAHVRAARDAVGGEVLADAAVLEAAHVGLDDHRWPGDAREL